MMPEVEGNSRIEFSPEERAIKEKLFRDIQLLCAGQSAMVCCTTLAELASSIVGQMAVDFEHAHQMMGLLHHDMIESIRVNWKVIRDTKLHSSQKGTA